MLVEIQTIIFIDELSKVKSITHIAERHSKLTSLETNANSIEWSNSIRIDKERATTLSHDKWFYLTLGRYPVLKV